MGSFRRLHRAEEGSPFPPDLSDPSYLNWIRSQPCANCSAPGPSHPHHSTVAPVTCEMCSGPPRERPQAKRGKGTKSHDHYAFPLCFKCHRRFHDAAGPFRDWTKAQRREWQERLSAEYHKRYYDTESF